MLIHPWDSAGNAEWRAWLADGHDFGQLIAVDPNYRPIVVPTHFHFDGVATIRLHLARPNPVWQALQARATATITVLDDYAFIPGTWRAGADVPAENGVPTSYYASVQLSGEVEIIDEPEAKAELLRVQLGHFQPHGDHGPVAVGQPPYGRLLAGIRGVVIRVTEVRAKFKYDDKKSGSEQLAVAARLTERASSRDVAASEQQLRRHDRRD